MGVFADYERYDALGLAALVRQGKVTPAALLEAAIERVEARNGQVNAVVLRLYDHARQAIAAGLPDGPLRGVPYLLKDLTASLAGVPMTRGSRFFADAPPPAADSEHVRRLKQAGTKAPSLASVLGPLQQVQRARVQFADDAPPAITVKLHEIFGVKEHPRICDGKVAVLVQLTAPDGKRLEATQNLEAFWKTSYPQLKRNALTKYKGVAWL